MESFDRHCYYFRICSRGIIANKIHIPLHELAHTGHAAAARRENAKEIANHLIGIGSEFAFAATILANVGVNSGRIAYGAV
jgi:hypothetical protein